MKPLALHIIFLFTLCVSAIAANAQNKPSVGAEKDTNVTVYINEPLRGIYFHYQAESLFDIVLDWNCPTPSGIKFTSNHVEKTIGIVGTPVAVGEYPYSISVKGGNTITGKITVVYPDAQVKGPEPELLILRAGETIPTLTWSTKYVRKATISGEPAGTSLEIKENEIVLAGTLAALHSYPQNFTYTINVEAQYEEAKDTTITGTIRVLAPDAKRVLYLYKGDCNNESVYHTLYSWGEELFAREASPSLRNTTDYEAYDLILLSESVDANNLEVLGIIQSITKPVLNMKVFTYTTSRLGWGYPDNGSLSNKEMVITQPSHPIFNGLDIKEGDELQLIEEESKLRGLMPARVIKTGSLCLGVAPKRGETYEDNDDLQTFVHEVYAKDRGAKYILFPVSSNVKLTEQGNRLLKNIIDYLTTEEASIELPELRVQSFSIDGYEGVINEVDHTITVEFDEIVDLQALTPDISLIGVGTFISPQSGEAVDFSAGNVTYVVSDYIHTQTYQVSVNMPTGVEDIYDTDIRLVNSTLQNPNGLWINIYDITGRLLTTTNADVDFTSYPHGVYLIQGTDFSQRVIW